MARTGRAKDLEDGIIEAVAVLDEADGSRTGLTEAIDEARNILQTAFGDTLDSEVESYLSSEENSDEDAEDSEFED